MTNKHTATDPAGIIHTRNSKTRVYKYTVVAKRSYAHAHEAAISDDSQARDKRSFDFYVNNHGNAEVASYGTASAYADAMRDEKIAHIVAKKADGYYDQWFNMGWCGRHDLAIKLRDTTAANPHYASVIILETVVKHHPPI